MPPTIEHGLEAALEWKIATACVRLVQADSLHFAKKYAGRIRHIPPLVTEDSIRLPDFMVQNVIERDAMNRLVGRAAKPLVHIRFALWHDVITYYRPNTVDSIENELVRLEQLLMLGTDSNNTGKLVDPAYADGPPTLKYLNERIFNVLRMPPVIHDLSSKTDSTALAVEYQLIVSFETHQNILTRRRIGE
jgi:hypothetical protein